MTNLNQAFPAFRTVVMAAMLCFMALLAAPSPVAAHDGVDHASDHEATAHLAATLAGDAAPVSLAGRVLLDVERNGEAWYVNPRTMTRTYLGRPNAALERLVSRVVEVPFAAIARLAETPDGDADHTYGASVAGQVLAPSDLVGAAWYVHPVTHQRMRLASPADAMEVMRTGIPVPSAAIDAIAEEAFAEARFAMAPRGEMTAAHAGAITFSNGTTVQLLSVETPANPELQEAAKALINARLATASAVLLERDTARADASGREQRFVLADGVNISHDLVRNGLAFPAISVPNLRHAEQLIVASLDAQRLQRGFWNPEYQRTGVLQPVVR